MKTQTSKLKDRQLEILMLLYRFRFLNRIQIQKLLNHKNHTLVIHWLNELVKTKHIVSEFKRQLGNIPSVYFLGTNGRKELLKKDGVIQKLLKRVYQEKKASQDFRRHCMVVADIYLSLIDLTKKHDAKLSFYTTVDLTDMKYLPLPHPDVFFSIQQKEITKRYFLDVFNPYASEKWLFKRVKQYFKYYEDDYWQDHNENPFPEIIFVCFDEKTKKNLIKNIKKGLEEEENLLFSLIMVEEIKKKGISKQTLERVN
jgi:hypothetical protein